MDSAVLDNDSPNSTTNLNFKECKQLLQDALYLTCNPRLKEA